MLLDDAGDCYLADFGIATDVVTASSPAAPAATPAASYTSPEQLAVGIATAQSDQYALAVMAWELLAGTPWNRQLVRSFAPGM